MQVPVGKVIWFTGLSGSGKSTLAVMLKEELERKCLAVALLDGDILRQGLNRDLGFSGIDRAENIRRAAEVAKILSDSDYLVICAFITPFHSIRKAVRGLFVNDEYVEVFLDCPLEICEQRDPKGLYSQARKGEVPEFTGVSSPFELPESPDLIIPTSSLSCQESLDRIIEYLERRFPEARPNHPRIPCALRRSRPKMAIIGLDSAPPSMVFGRYDLPNLRTLMEHGRWGKLRSTDPPITVPAWTTMTTGRDPGELGLYGFRNRLSHDYDHLSTVNRTHVTVPRVWDYLENAGNYTITLGVPQTYPPRPHNGVTVADFLAPDVRSGITYPPELAAELDRMADGPYMLDVKDFRSGDKKQLLDDIYAMVNRRFKVAEELIKRRRWDFFMMVEIGLDRMHHAFWGHCTPGHKDYVPGNPFEHALSDFYKYLDHCVGRLLMFLDDDTTVMVISDHGVKSATGGFCINEWLIRNEWLNLLEYPESEVPLTPDMVDWSRTKAWSEGGYYARVFMNVKGREPQGIIEPDQYESCRNRLSETLSDFHDDSGASIRNVVLKPGEIYRDCRNVPPDLMVYFDDLALRSIGTVGSGSIVRNGNTRGMDSANHDYYGIYIQTRLSDLRRGITRDTLTENISCLDITPTILDEFGLAVPEGLGGKAIKREGIYLDRTRKSQASEGAGERERTYRHAGFTSEEEAVVVQRLKDLGYL
ncbi:MAG: adenylyl-sulfate kinase [Desulfomonile tiedjei]|uniref:Adenylyl-sulfate kinase n=1 Tax=Desulfomonile tiedjei TaxID=2358 RepID=A0A9D6V092_9BACT|nr:adenylyl-sulfate kinase [Desulfomonile tiedjei]